MRIKKGDKVKVITGAYKGTIGEVKAVFPKEDRVIVEGVNMVTKHQKQTREMQQAGIVHKEGTINTSNVMLYCDKCKSGVRTESKIENGKKVRACKKCGTVL